MKLENNKNVIITGCSSGIGYATAIKLNNEGYNVFATCRKEKDLKKLKSLGINAIVLDYSDEGSIFNASKYILKKFNNDIYALFNNGAYALPGALEDIPSQALREIIETNLIGYHSLNRLIIPSMRKNGYGKIIHCSSVLGFICLPFRGAYNISKWALEGYCDTLRLELDGTGINVISIRPGPINTKIKENSIYHFEKWIKWEKSPLKKLYLKKLLPKLYKINKVDRFELEPEVVASIVLKILKNKNPSFTYNVTIPTHIGELFNRILPKKIFQKLILKLYS